MGHNPVREVALLREGREIHGHQAGVQGPQPSAAQLSTVHSAGWRCSVNLPVSGELRATLAPNQVVFLLKTVSKRSFHFIRFLEYYNMALVEFSPIYT